MESSFVPGGAGVVSVIVVGQTWRGGLASCGDPCWPDVAERGVHFGSFLGVSAAFGVCLKQHAWMPANRWTLVTRISSEEVRSLAREGRGTALIGLSKSEGKKDVPLLLGRSCVFVAKIPGFGWDATAVSLWLDGNKKSFGCHALLELGRCTFVATKVKRPRCRRGGKCEARILQGQTDSLSFWSHFGRGAVSMTEALLLFG